jgi:hypothetical protein
MAYIFKGKKQQQMLASMQQNKNVYTLLVEIQISTTIMENSMDIPQKAKNRTTVLSSDIASGHLPKGT